MVSSMEKSSLWILFHPLWSGGGKASQEMVDESPSVVIRSGVDGGDRRAVGRGCICAKGSKRKPAQASRPFPVRADEHATGAGIVRNELQISAYRLSHSYFRIDKIRPRRRTISRPGILRYVRGTARRYGSQEYPRHGQPYRRIRSRPRRSGGQV